MGLLHHIPIVRPMFAQSPQLAKKAAVDAARRASEVRREQPTAAQAAELAVALLAERFQTLAEIDVEEQVGVGGFLFGWHRSHK